MPETTAKRKTLRSLLGKSAVRFSALNLPLASLLLSVAGARSGRLRRLTATLRPRTQEDGNILYLYVDIAFQGVVAGAGAAYLSVFAVRLGASTFLVGLLASVPALILTLLSLPAGRFVAKQPRLVPVIVRCGSAFNAAYLLVALASWLLPRYAPQAVVVIWALASVALAFSSVAFVAALGEAVPPSRRGNVISIRYAIHACVAAVTLQITGRVLTWVPFPLNYQVVFLASFLAGTGSIWIIRKMRLPEQRPPAPALAIGSTSQRWRAAFVALRLQAPFFRYLTSSSVFRLGMSLPNALYSVFWVKHLHLSDGTIALAIALNYGSNVFGYYLWNKVAKRKGRAWVLAASCLGVATYPLLTGLARSSLLILIVSVIGGLFGAGMTVSFMDVLLATAPAEQRSSYVALDSAVGNGTAFLGPLLGSLLANSLGIRIALFMGFAVRVLGVGLFAVSRVGDRAERTQPGG